MKSGILETADILVVNKSDQPDARQLATELGSVRKLRKTNGWEPPVVSTSFNDPASFSHLVPRSIVIRRGLPPVQMRAGGSQPVVLSTLRALWPVG
jgi:Methylmalonyl Co-A mutase-associated GTPase MeaB